MYTKLSIANLRGIKNLDIIDMSRINILVGPNNCGKTTILESIFLSLGMSNPRLLVTINNLRELLINERNDLRFNFRDFDYANTIKIEAFDSNDGHRKVEIIPVPAEGITQSTAQQQTKAQQQDGETIDTDTSSPEEAAGLRLEYRKGNGKTKVYESNMLAQPEGIKIEIDKSYREPLKGRFLNTATLFSNLTDRIDKVQKAKKKDRLINVLQKVEPKVTDIAVSTSGLIYVDIGISQLVPINLLGDGFKKACAIVANLLVLQDGFLLIDEIENGLHRDTLSILWKAMYEASSEFNVQLFLATHSYEAIQVLVQTIQENNYEKEDLRLFSIQKNQADTHKCYTYKFDNLEAALESEVDIRGKQLLNS